MRRCGSRRRARRSRVHSIPRRKSQPPSRQPVTTNGKAGGYREKLPNEPWGAEYQSLHPGRNGEMDIDSLGADSQAGGEGNDADIGNWNQ